MSDGNGSAENFENFLKEIGQGKEVTVETLDGSRVKVILVTPHAADANRASELVDKILAQRNTLNSLDTASRYLNELITLACVSCIKGVTYENVMGVLRSIPQNSPLVEECLKLMGLNENQMQGIGIKLEA